MNWQLAPTGRPEQATLTGMVGAGVGSDPTNWTWNGTDKPRFTDNDDEPKILIDKSAAVIVA